MTINISFKYFDIVRELHVEVKYVVIISTKLTSDWKQVISLSHVQAPTYLIQERMSGEFSLISWYLSHSLVHQSECLKPMTSSVTCLLKL